MTRRVLALAVSLVGGAALLAAAQEGTLETDAERMSAKLAAIIEHGDAVLLGSRETRRTSFTEREVNAYFRVSGPEFLPEGVSNPRLVLQSGGRLQARAIVDLDRALKTQERSWLDPLAWVGGDVEVTAAGTLTASRRQGELEIERATLAGLSIPTTLLQELVSYYSRTEDDPDGFRLDEPFELPAQIVEVEFDTGRATVVQ